MYGSFGYESIERNLKNTTYSNTSRRNEAKARFISLEETTKGGKEMSGSINQIDNTEYYLETDSTRKVVNVMKYVFNIFHPNGKEHKLMGISYRKKSGYTCEEAEHYLRGIVDMLNNTDWSDENNVY